MSILSMWRTRTVALLLTSGIGLSGCASFSPDSGMSVVSDVASQTIGKDVAFVRSADDSERAGGTVRRLLGRPLTVDTAVQVALLGNKGLQAAYNELALAETDLVQQSLPPNPTFFDLPHRRQRRQRNRTAGRRRHPCARHPAVALRHRARTVSARRSCAPRSKPCGSPPRSVARIFAASPPMTWSVCSPTPRSTAESTRSSPSSSARPAR